MKKIILFGLLVLLIIGIVLISGCTQQESERVTEKEPPIEIYKGIWLPTSLVEDPDQIASKMQKFKDIGGNTVFIQGFPVLPESWFEKQPFPPETLEKIKEILPIEKELIIANIQTAHKNGLKVGLTIDTLPGLEEIDLEASNSKIVEYARLAEEYDVELFAPMNEPGKILGENTGKWRQEILPRIKKVYHGEIVWKGAGPDLPDKITISKIAKQPPGDFSGYDYIGFSSFHVSREGLTPEEQLQYADRLTLEGYSQYVDGALDYMLALAERDNSKGVIITEFGVWPPEGVSEEEIVRAHEIVLERGKGKVVGFFVMDFLGGEIPGMPPIKEDLKTEEVIRKWFTEILK